MPSRVAPACSGYQTPRKQSLRASKRFNYNELEDSGISPEKKECKTPVSKAAEAMEKLTVQTPNKRQIQGKSLFSGKENQQSPTRSRGRPPKAAAPVAKLEIFAETDENLEMEMDEDNNENVPVVPERRRSVGRPRKAQTAADSLPKLEVIPKDEVENEPWSTKSEIFTPTASTQYLKIQPIILKKIPDRDEYRVSHTPRAPKYPSRRSVAQKVEELMDLDYAEDSSSSDSDSEASSLESRSSSPAAVSRRKTRGGLVAEPVKTAPPRFVGVPRTLMDLRSVLHTSEMPEKMPHRDQEHKAIRNFVVEGVKAGSVSQSMYISGVPGTGKTASTLCVVREVSKQHKFTFVMVNAMELMEPKDLFVQIYKGIFESDKRISAQNARLKLNQLFASPDKRRPPVVLLVDELDMLCTKKQDILYDVFNWTTCAEARVTIISISNTLDLPERVMSQRISSRLGTHRVVFQPYTYPEIQEIVMSKVSKAGHLVHEQAVELVAKKVANISGDLRKAMDLLRRGIEIAVEKGDTEQLKFEHVNAAAKELAAAPRNILGENLSCHAFILFRGALCQVQSTGVEEFMFTELYRQYRILCTSLEGVNPLHDYGMHHVLMELCSNRMLVASPGSSMIRRKIRLAMSTIDAQALVRQVEEARKAGSISYV